jgi:hypothetical protein
MRGKPLFTHGKYMGRPLVAGIYNSERTAFSAQSARTPAVAPAGTAPLDDRVSAVRTAKTTGKNAYDQKEEEERDYVSVVL